MLLSVAWISAAVYEETGGRVVIEAEHFHARTRHAHGDGQDHHWHVVPDDDGTDFIADVGDPPFDNARGGKYVQVLPNGPGGGGPNIDPMLDFKAFIQQTGEYRLYVRWRGASGSDDSFYASMAELSDGVGGAIADWYRFSQGSGTDFANRWQGSAGFEKTDASGGDVPASWNITKAGLYTIRITQREDGAAVDAALFQRSNMTAPEEPGPAESSVTAKYPLTVAMRSPVPNQTGVSGDASIVIELEDGGSTQVNQSSVKLTLNGTSLTPSVTKSGTRTKVTAKPAAPLAGNLQATVVLSFSDTATPPNAFTDTWLFETDRTATSLPSLREDELGFVVIEVEKFHVKEPKGQHNWIFVKTPTGYSGDGAMFASPDDPGASINYPDSLATSPRLDFKVNFVKTGPHYLWFRGSDGGGNSINAGFNGDSPGDTFNNIDAGCCGTRIVPSGLTWTWVGGTDATPEGRSKFDVPTAGVHTMNLWMREDGQIVDKILITTDPNFVPTDAGPPESRRVGDPFLPIVNLTAPTDGATFPAAADITLTANATDADGTIAKIEFFEGANKIGEDTTPPFSVTWKPAEQRFYRISAKATDNAGDTAVSKTAKIAVGAPPKVLFLGNDPAINAGDQFIIKRLDARGFEITAVDDNASLTSDADGKSLIVISSTVGSGNITDKYTALPIPILNWEEALMDDLLMTGDSGTDPDHHGTTGSQTSLEIVRANHPLVAGLSSGVQVVSNSPQTFTWGFPDINSANANVVATLAGRANQVGIFAYEKGAILFDGATPAPARRIGFFFNADSTLALNDIGLRLYDAAVNWALNITPPAPPAEPAKLTVSRSANNVAVSWIGAGKLQVAEGVTGPWTDASSQSNPQSVTISSTAKFFRVRQ